MIGGTILGLVRIFNDWVLLRRNELHMRFDEMDTPGRFLEGTLVHVYAFSYILSNDYTVMNTIAHFGEREGKNCIDNRSYFHSALN